LKRGNYVDDGTSDLRNQRCASRARAMTGHACTVPMSHVAISATRCLLGHIYARPVAYLGFGRREPVVFALSCISGVASSEQTKQRREDAI